MYQEHVMKPMRGTLLALCAMGLSGVAWGQAPPSSNYEKLKELDKWVGTWEVTGEAFDGTPYEAVHNWRWGLNKNYLMGTFIRKVDGTDRVIAKTMIGWDVVDKRIEGSEFWDDSQGEFVVGDDGRIAGGGAFHDGDQYTFEGKMVWQNDDSQSYTAKIKKGDSEPGTWTISLKRKQPTVAKVTGIPAEALAAMKYRVGRWKSTGWIDDVEQPQAGDEVTVWDEQKCCIKVTNSFVENGVTIHSTGLIGWDPATKQLVEHWYASDGSVATFWYFLDKQKDAWVGTCKWIYADGRVLEGDSVVVKKGADEWEWKATCSVAGSDKKTVWKSANRRVK
jgi:hypothetical protein